MAKPKRLLWPAVKEAFEGEGLDLSRLSDKAAAELTKLVNKDGLDLAISQILEVDEDSERWEQEIFFCRPRAKKSTKPDIPLDGAALFGGSWSEGDKD